MKEDIGIENLTGDIYKVGAMRHLTHTDALPSSLGEVGRKHWI